MKLIIALALGAAAHAADDLKEVHGHGRRLGALDGTIYSLETTFDVAGGRKLTEQELETTFNEDNGAMANFFDVEVLQDLTIKNFDVHAAQTGIRVRVPVGPPQPALRLREDRLLRPRRRRASLRPAASRSKRHPVGVPLRAQPARTPGE